MLAFLILWLGYLAYMAVIVQINHFDTYSVLNNARLILRGGDYPYELIRPPLLSMLISPLFLFKFLAMTQIVVIARLLAVLIFAAYLAMAYKIFRLHLEKSLALLGVVLMSLNPLLVADAPFCREDILGALLAAGTLYSYILWRRHAGRSVWLVICLTASALCRYNLGPLVVLTLS